MKKKESFPSRPSANPPDDSLKAVEEETEEEPVIYKVARRHRKDKTGRREFLGSLGRLGVVTVASTMIKGCDDSEYKIVADEDACACHVVCTCDSEDSEDGVEKDIERDSVYSGDECVCDTVCTCDLVCHCESVCGCNTEGGSGCGGGYVSYWYPN